MRTIREYISSAARVGASVALAAALAVGVGLVPASAQYSQDRYYGHDYGVNDRNLGRQDIRRLAAVNGYSSGYEDGIRDRRSRRNFDYRNHDDYRQATNGYDRDWGRLNDYRGYFRQGYVQGYSDGYYQRARNRNFARNNSRVYDNRNSPYDPYYNYPSYRDYPGYNNNRYYSNSEGDIDREEVAERAAQNGYYAGYQRGLYDAQHRARPNPTGHGAYQHGFDGFDPEWGSASTYQQYYRNYFVQGYNDAFSRRQFNRRYSRRY